MEYVEVKGRSVSVAVEAALAELGLESEEHAVVEIIQEPEKGFLGIGAKDAIVRVKAKPKRRRRRRRRGSGDGQSGQQSAQQSAQQSGQPRSGQRSGGQSDQRSGSRPSQQSQKQRSSSPKDDRSKPSQGQKDGGGRGSRPPQQKARGGSKGGDAARQGGADRSRKDTAKREGTVEPESQNDRPTIDRDEQRQIVHEFLEGLLDAFGLDGQVETRLEEDIVLADLVGEQTEALIGPKATILHALHELSRTVVQRQTHEGVRIRLDINGYGVRRREALSIYAGRLAEQVLGDGEEVMLEPMGASDRKVIHDAVSEIDGVQTYSEGEEPYRSVVIAPA